MCSIRIGFLAFIKGFFKIYTFSSIPVVAKTNPPVIAKVSIIISAPILPKEMFPLEGRYLCRERIHAPPKQILAMTLLFNMFSDLSKISLYTPWSGGNSSYFFSMNNFMS